MARTGRVEGPAVCSQPRSGAAKPSTSNGSAKCSRFAPRVGSIGGRCDLDALQFYVGADDACVAGHVVGDHRVGAHAFLQSEVFAGVTGIDGVDQRFDALTVAAGMLQVINIVLIKHG